MNKIVEFLHQLPFFKVWTKTSLSKLQYSFEQRSFIRNQIIYKEGDPSSMAYIIKTGEFEVAKKFRKMEKKHVDIGKLLFPNKNEGLKRKEEEQNAYND